MTPLKYRIPAYPRTEQLESLRDLWTGLQSLRIKPKGNSNEMEFRWGVTLRMDGGYEVARVSDPLALSQAQVRASMWVTAELKFFGRWPSNDPTTNSTPDPHYAQGTVVLALGQDPSITLNLTEPGGHKTEWSEWCVPGREPLSNDYGALCHYILKEINDRFSGAEAFPTRDLVDGPLKAVVEHTYQTLGEMRNLQRQMIEMQQSLPAQYDRIREEDANRSRRIEAAAENRAQLAETRTQAAEEELKRLRPGVSQTRGTRRTSE